MERKNDSTYSIYRRRVAYHETDAMAVVHHSNYVRMFEEARVHWIRERRLNDLHVPKGPYTFAVVDLGCKFLKPARFEDEIEVWVAGQLVGARIKFRYAVWNRTLGAWSATGFTDLVPLTDDLKPVRLPASAREVFANDTGGEPWPPVHPSVK